MWDWVLNFPEDWVFGWDLIKIIDHAVDWIIINGEAFFEAINIGVLRGILIPLEKALLWAPWWAVIVLTGIVAWRAVSVRFAIITAAFLLFMPFMGLLDDAAVTLSITLASTIICIVLGLPLGIIAAKSDRFDNFLRPILDSMQTMPSFVYLIPAVMLFGMGPVPAVMATVIYAIPPIIRLTSLGIRQVMPSAVEAARSFGASPGQVLATACLAHHTGRAEPDDNDGAGYGSHRFHDRRQGSGGRSTSRHQPSRTGPGFHCRHLHRVPGYHTG